MSLRRHETPQVANAILTDAALDINGVQEPNSIKLKAMAPDVLRDAATHGTFDAQWHFLFCIIRFLWHCDTQENEGINNMIQELIRAAANIGLALVSARTTLKKELLRLLHQIMLAEHLPERKAMRKAVDDLHVTGSLGIHNFIRDQGPVSYRLSYRLNTSIIYDSTFMRCHLHVLPMAAVVKLTRQLVNLLWNRIKSCSYVLGVWPVWPLVASLARRRASQYPIKY